MSTCLSLPTNVRVWICIHASGLVRASSVCVNWCVCLWCSLPTRTHTQITHTSHAWADNRLAKFINSNVNVYRTLYAYINTCSHSCSMLCSFFIVFSSIHSSSSALSLTHLRFAIVCIHTSTMYMCVCVCSHIELFYVIFLRLFRFYYNRNEAINICVHTNTNNRNRITMRLFRLDYSFQFTHSARNINKWFFEDRERGKWPLLSGITGNTERVRASKCEGIWIDVS